MWFSFTFVFANDWRRAVNPLYRWLMLLLLFALLPAGLSAATVRRYEVAIHRSKYAKCDGADLRIDRGGVKATRCRGIDFTLKWKEVKSVCYEYGFRGVVELRTASAPHRISTTTPAEAKRIVESIRDLNPSLPRSEGCGEK